MKLNKILPLALLLVLPLILAYGTPEFKTTDDYIITVTNSSQAITGATVDYEVFFLDNRSSVINGQFAEWGSGDYYFALSSIPVKDDTYYIHINITYGTNEIHVSDTFKMVDDFSQTDLDTIKTYTDSVESNQATMTAQITQNTTAVIDNIDSNLSAIHVWNLTDRTLTFYPPTTAITTIDLAREGLTNASLYYTEVDHILGSTEPENDQSLATDFYKRIVFDLGTVPTNIQQCYLVYWLKKAGSPTDSISIFLNDVSINISSPTKLTTSYVKRIINFSCPLTSNYVQIEFIGNSSYTPANNVLLGAGELASTNSFTSPDGSTWAHSDNEFTVGLFIEFNQTFTFDDEIADAVWNESTSGHTTPSTFGAELGSVQDNFSDIQTNFTQVINNSVYGLQAIKDYLVSTIYGYLVSTIYSWLTSNLDSDIIGGSVWNQTISYNDTSGTYPSKVNETLKDIAENTETGGW